MPGGHQRGSCISTRATDDFQLVGMSCENQSATMRRGCQGKKSSVITCFLFVVNGTWNPKCLISSGRSFNPTPATLRMQTRSWLYCFSLRAAR